LTPPQISQEELNGTEAQGDSKKVQSEVSDQEKEEKVARREAERMSEHADIVVVQYPRGVTALVWFDLATGVIATSHAGLRDTLRRGIRDWQGHLVHPHDGHLFMCAVYDHFFLSGYPVHWLSASGLMDVRNAYRV
jgi:hypothetical protein